jgi:uncharacterized protein YuzE
MNQNENQERSFFAKVKAGMQELNAWAAGETALPVTTEVNGAYTTTEQTGPEAIVSRQADLAFSEPLSYDASVDSLYIDLSDEGLTEPIATSEEIAPGVLVDYDKDGRVVGVELRAILARLKSQTDAPIRGRKAPIGGRGVAA